MDDDAILREGGLQSLYDFIEVNKDVSIINGRAVIKYTVPRPEWCTKKVESWLGVNDYGNETTIVTGKTIKDKKAKIAIGCCFIIKKSILEAIGCFDVTTGRIGHKMLAGEETLIARKVLNQGGKIFYLPSVSVDHVIDPKWLNQKFLLNKTYFYGISNANVQLLIEGSIFNNLKYLGYRLIFLCKNLFDILLSSIVFKNNKRFESLLLLNFNFRIVYQLIKKWRCV